MVTGENTKKIEVYRCGEYQNYKPREYYILCDKCQQYSSCLQLHIYFFFLLLATSCILLIACQDM